MAGIWPLLLQLPIIFGLIDVVYKPLKHLLHMPASTIDAFVRKAGEILGTTDLGSSPQLKVVELLSNAGNVPRFMELQGSLEGVDVASAVSSIQSVQMNFLGINLAATPSFSFTPLLLIPILAGLSALVMCVIQNRINVLQVEQNKLSQWGMTLFMIAFSTYFAFLVPAGVGLYWIFGNLFSIGVMYLVNVIYNPKKYIDYKALTEIKQKTAPGKGNFEKKQKTGEKVLQSFLQAGQPRTYEADVLRRGKGLLQIFLQYHRSYTPGF